MRLFHVSEEPNIKRFMPRIPTRADLDKSTGLVWAITEHCLPNFLTPRECPRVTYHANSQTNKEDIVKFFASANHHCVAIEHAWFEQMRNTTLYLYEFDTKNFYLQDECAGYYVSQQTETPIGQTRIDDLFGALFARGVEVRLIDSLWALADAVKRTTLRWSICDMTKAQPNPITERNHHAN